MIVHTVADYLLSKGVKPNGEPMTQLSLQKMLYFSQGWHLAIREATPPHPSLGYGVGAGN
jgi:uncharacterized phage-associated protein